jgi:hypothetical protein
VVTKNLIYPNSTNKGTPPKKAGQPEVTIFICFGFSPPLEIIKNVKRTEIAPERLPNPHRQTVFMF